MKPYPPWICTHSLATRTATSPVLSFRPERPDFLFRAAFRRVGPRSGGIVAPLPL